MFSSAFTDWHQKPMREIIQFCTENDADPPNFIPELIQQGLIRPECGLPHNAPMKDFEKSKIDTKLKDYYDNNWSSVIINILNFKNPLVANAHALTSISAKVDQSC